MGRAEWSRRDLGQFLCKGTWGKCPAPLIKHANCPLISEAKRCKQWASWGTLVPSLKEYRPRRSPEFGPTAGHGSFSLLGFPISKKYRCLFSAPHKGVYRAVRKHNLFLIDYPQWTFDSCHLWFFKFNSRIAFPRIVPQLHVWITLHVVG
jgi:hypothetical protein